jgi:AraC-like DNA-binding protein
MMIHPREHEYAWAPQGAVEIETPGDVLRADENWAVWIPAGLPHTVRPVDDRAILLPAFFPARTCEDWFGEATVLARDPRVDVLAARAAQPGIHGLRTAQREALALHALIGGSQRERETLGPELAIPRQDPARSVARCLLRTPSRAEGLDEWAESVHVCARTLQRSFSSQTGMSFSAWRTRQRVRSAVPLLRDGLSVAEAAEAVGFASPSAFSSACRATTGRTPGDLRSAEV